MGVVELQRERTSSAPSGSAGGEHTASTPRGELEERPGVPPVRFPDEYALVNKLEHPKVV
ncbi:hypothetical protein [Actinomadura rugatobispora]|uniref:Uncharacterized protein n=1 Tax=Actinomadura rugatobispora TaxID=1994 RepID=A0ABW1AF04_9ACTN